ncbi:MAG TPA: hypothetical protein VF487_20175 [Chitinophagaceae bacterium]
MLKIDVTAADAILKECEQIQSFLEADYPIDEPAACEAKGKELEVYMARSGKMLADAKYWQDQFVNSAITETVREALLAQKVWSISLVNKKVDALAKEYNYLVNWCDRINRTCTHQLDFIRTMLSKHKAEMQMSGYGR